MSAWRFLKLQTKWGSAFKSICQWSFAWVAENYQSLCLPEAGMFVCRSERGPAAPPAPPGLSGPQLCSRTTQLLGRVTFLAVLPLPVHVNLSWVRLFLLGGFLAAVVPQLGALCLCSLWNWEAPSSTAMPHPSFVQECHQVGGQLSTLKQLSAGWLVELAVSPLQYYSHC